jgi:glycosyltransferase involved in cell wall biosynthesis
LSKIRKAFSISMAKNEAETIESFVRYHLNIFDGMVIIDNGSTDNTSTILEKLKSEGIPLYVQRVMDSHFNYDEKMTELLYETFNQHQPDIIFCLDADEFLFLQNNVENPSQFIKTLATDRLYYVGSEAYFPDPKDNAHELFLPKRMIHSSYKINDYKVAVPKGLINYFPKIKMGSHDLIFKKEYQGKINAEVVKGLTIAHFPYRSVEQIKSKALVGWISNLTRYNRPEYENWHWKEIFDKLKENLNVDYHDIMSTPPLQAKPINLSYCKDISIKYTTANEMNAIKNLLEYCEALAMDYAKLKRELLK